MDASIAIRDLKTIFAWLERIHDPEMPQYGEQPDQVESIQIIHLAASIAALESEC